MIEGHYIIIGKNIITMMNVYNNSSQSQSQGQ